MKVQDLVALLQKCDQDAEAFVWHPYHDCPSRDVLVSVTGVGEVHVGTAAFGTEVMPDVLVGKTDAPQRDLPHHGFTTSGAIGMP